MAKRNHRPKVHGIFLRLDQLTFRYFIVLNITWLNC
ncbi:hypothetical protein vBEcoMWL3_gp147 [Escherichia phage vB_EcoM_WL-3]|nr:hypothetical protein vBEcoMWL3_gp147 [Escherichia phage vB_EcoM_WL-3]